MKKLTDWLFKKENRPTLFRMSILMVLLPLAYAIGVGFQGDAHYEGLYPSRQWITEWFRQFFEGIMMLSFVCGLILLLIVPFGHRRNGNDDD